MRFSLAAILLIAGSFIFFTIWAVMTFVLREVTDALAPTASGMVLHYFDLIQLAFGVIAALFFFSGLILVFIIDATADEEEMYWRGQ